ncbi:MAG: LCP family protein [Lachnospiraceae bacterium]|nr:LCP family protein [Lachnospiraceae bacterium]
MAVKKKKKGKAAHRKRNIIILCTELVLVLVLGIVLRTVAMPVSKMGRIDLDDTKLRSQMNEGVLNNETLQNYHTFALFGVDSRQEQLDRATLSDVIIIASVNKTTGDIRLCSVYRDTYMDLCDGDYGKITAAYSLGGPEKAINALNRNLDLNITDFVTIGFKGLTDVIDALGGIDIDVSEEAYLHLNNYQITMAQEFYNLPTIEDVIPGQHYIPLTQGGYQHLNGLQATAYCRVRYLSGDDLTRSQHQREVLQAVFDKAKTASIPQLTAIADSVFPEVYTSMDLAEIIRLVSDIGKYNLVGQAGFPQKEMLSFGMIRESYAGSSIIATDLASNVVWLHLALYGVENYQLTPQAQQISDTVRDRTYPYMQ